MQIIKPVVFVYAYECVGCYVITQQQPGQAWTRTSWPPASACSGPHLYQGVLADYVRITETTHNYIHVVMVVM